MTQLNQTQLIGFDQCVLSPSKALPPASRAGAYLLQIPAKLREQRAQAKQQTDCTVDVLEKYCPKNVWFTKFMN